MLPNSCMSLIGIKQEYGSLKMKSSHRKLEKAVIKMGQRLPSKWRCVAFGDRGEISYYLVSGTLDVDGGIGNGR